MSDSDFLSGSEPNAFDGESSDGQSVSESSPAGLGPMPKWGPSSGSEEAEVEALVRKAPAVLRHGRGKVLPAAEVMPLAAVPGSIDCTSTSRYCDFLMGDTQRPEGHASYQSEASTSGRVEGAAEASSLPVLTVVQPSNPRVPIGRPRETLFGVDYLGANLISERELDKLRSDYLIPDSVRWRIPAPTESLSTPREGETVFFTDMLKLGVRLPLQPPIQDILAHLGYAVGQYNPNFWTVLVAIVTAFGIAGEGVPSYEQFSYLYSVTKAKSTDHGGWVQANCLQASARGHFISSVPSSQKSWRNRRVLISGDWEAPSARQLFFRIPTSFQLAGRSLVTVR